jgi:DNA-binding protein HU-beta
MNKTELVAAVVKATALSNTVTKEVIDATLSAIKNALAAGEEAALLGFGTFKSVDKPAHTGRNPKTGETLQIAARKSVKFKAGKELSDAVQ